MPLGPEFQPEGTFRAYFQLKLSPRWLSTKFSSGFFGVLLPTPADEAIEAWSLACRMHLLDDPESPDDILPVLANDRRLSRYPLETALQHRGRLFHAWDIYALGGTETGIETQIAAAGFGPATLLGPYGNPAVTYGDPTYYYGDLGVRVEFRPTSPGPRGEPPPYRTQFWLVFAPGFHPVTGPAAPWGTWVWGDTWLTVPGVWAPLGLTADFYRTVMEIVMKWKPSDYVFRGFSFLISDVPYGLTTLTYGDTSVFYGGTVDMNLPADVSL